MESESGISQHVLFVITRYFGDHDRTIENAHAALTVCDEWFVCYSSRRSSNRLYGVRVSACLHVDRDNIASIYQILRQVTDCCVIISSIVHVSLHSRLCPIVFSISVQILH